MKIKVYSTPHCPYCTRVKAYLIQKNLKFEDIDVSVDPGRVREMIDKSRQMGVPVIEINEKIITGFDKDAIDEALESSAK